MKDEIIEGVVEERELMTPDEMVVHVLEDIVGGNPPNDVADEFIEDFVKAGRPETDQILLLLDAPSDVIAGQLKVVVAQGYQAQLAAIDSRGIAFLDSLKAVLRSRLAELAEDATEAE